MRGLMRDRDARIVLDYLSDTEFKSDVNRMWKLAQREGISTQRVSQIVEKGKRLIRWVPGMPLSIAGARMAREPIYMAWNNAETPEEFYWEVETERNAAWAWGGRQ